MCIAILAVKQTLKLWRFRSGRLTAILHVNEKLCVVQDGDIDSYMSNLVHYKMFFALLCQLI
jgi:hypothetical protein